MVAMLMCICRNMFNVHMYLLSNHLYVPHMYLSSPHLICTCPSVSHRLSLCLTTQERIHVRDTAGPIPASCSSPPSFGPSLIALSTSSPAPSYTLRYLPIPSLSPLSKNQLTNVPHCGNELEPEGRQADFRLVWTTISSQTSTKS